MCFTDIPLNFCDEQTAVYGKFGIGFKKSFVKRFGGNPVRYFIDHPASFNKPNLDFRGVFLYHLEELANMASKIKSHIDKEEAGLFNKAGKEIVTKNELQDYYDILVYIFGHEKPTGDLGSARNDTEEEDIYYKEREWRIVPSKLATELFINKNNIPIDKDDIRIIVVPSVNIKREVVKFLRDRESFRDDLPAILIYDELKYF